MDPLEALLGVVGLLLVFVLPGYTWTRALFPEWRLAGPDAGRRLVETLALTLVLSVSTTIVAGYLLLETPSVGFAATWTDPLLEIVLAAAAAVGFGVAALRGAFARVPPTAPPTEIAPGENDGWPILERLDAIDRERRRLRHQLRHPPSTAEASRWRDLLTQLDAEADALQRRREAEYAR